MLRMGEGRAASSRKRDKRGGGGGTGFLLLFCWGFLLFSNKRFLENCRSGEPPSSESPSTHPPSATFLPSRISGTGGRDAAVLRRAAMFPGAPEAHPSPHGGRGPGSAGTVAPSGGGPGAHRHSRSSAARSWGSGLERARRAGDPRPPRICGPSALAICTPRPLGDLAPGCPGSREVQGRQSPAVCRWLLSRAPSCHFVTVAVVALGGGEKLAPSPRRPPSSEVAAWGAGPWDTPTLFSHSAL